MTVKMFFCFFFMSQGNGLRKCIWKKNTISCSGFPNGQEHSVLYSNYGRNSKVSMNPEASETQLALSPERDALLER